MILLQTGRKSVKYLEIFCILVMLCSQCFVQSKTLDEKKLHRRPARNSWDENTEMMIGKSIHLLTLCQSPLYKQHVKNNSKVNSLELTDQEVEDFFSDMFNWLSYHFYNEIDIVLILSNKTFPEIKNFLLKNNFVSSTNMLDLGRCRDVSLESIYRMYITVKVQTTRTTAPPEPVTLPTTTKTQTTTVVNDIPGEMVFGKSIRLITLCQSPLYVKYVKDNPKLNTLSFTNEEMDEFFSDMFNWLSYYLYNEIESVILLSKKSYPAIVDFLVTHGIVSSTKDLNLAMCRGVSLDSIYTMYLTGSFQTERTTTETPQTTLDCNNTTTTP